jgi:3-methylcrotonyl-CoA carboxylase alpha subunit
LRHEADEPADIRVWPLQGGGYKLELPGGTIERAVLSADDDGDIVMLDGVSQRLHVVADGEGLTVIAAGRNHRFVAEDPLSPPAESAGSAERVMAPIPGRVTRLLAAAGDQVAKGAPLVVIEAMKMEITLRAPFDGTVEQIRCAQGDLVEEGLELVTFAKPGATP